MTILESDRIVDNPRIRNFPHGVVALRNSISYLDEGSSYRELLGEVLNVT